ncbi:uncharacterized protein N7443_004768, partial [Penicillium atrosanguineum]|uniref:uncharacterized protein n=1 Tax=Penicillium atrosanguineum TaxID=1132637 RepID=UPI002381F2DE
CFSTVEAMSDPARYTVGLICALSVEYIAAREFLDEEHDKPSFVSPNDANDYTLGKIGKHNVVIAKLPDGEYGTASAASVATDMLNSFHNIRIGLMVGIGGGVPSESHDIRLGDVVVGAPRGGKSGVLQYDFGKSIQNQSFQHPWFFNLPPAILRAAIADIQTQYERKGHQFEEAINSVLRKNIRLRQMYKRPEPIADRLFLPEVIHHQVGCEKCAADPSTLVLRSERADDKYNPAIHYGLIASSNQLMKDAVIRDRLAAENDVLCFEMAAAGLMNTFPCLVIRGICDYSDSHKNKEWQGYAAIVAAAYAKDLLQRIPPNRIEAEERVSVIVCEELKGINHRLDQVYSQQERHFSEQIARALTDQQRRCHHLFKVVNYAEQKNINQKRAKGTCRWALQSSEYIRWWESNSNDLLWVSADPGCGKSVLARSIIDDYSENSHPSVRICYFFFNENDQQNNLATALCSVLHQLFSQQPYLLQHAIPTWEKNGETLRQEVDELWRILIAVASADTSCNTICVLDALDQCREMDQRRFIEKLQAFHRQPSSLIEKSCLKFLLTSRPYDHIQYHFRAITASFPRIHIKGEEQNDQIHEEIDLVVRARVRELAETIPLSPDLHHRIEQQLLKTEHRTYLWLHLAIDDIRTTFKDGLRPVEDWITLIPPSVNAAYEKILSRVPADQMEEVKKILEIIVAARRPLTIQEMAMALGIATSSGSSTKQAGLDLIGLDGILRRCCGLLIFTSNSKIFLIHQTAREFLITKKDSNNPNCAYWHSLTDAEDQMAKICLRYLLMEDSKYDGESGPFSGSFLEYSAVHWPDHVRNMSLTSMLKETDRVHRLYDTNGKPFLRWFPIFWRTIRPYERAPVMSALHLAAFNGHEQQVYSILDVDENDVNAPDDTGIYPVTWASINGHDRIVQLMLERGADANAQGGEYGNALQAACDRGHDKIAQMLLDQGADVNAQVGSNGNALQAACDRGHDKIAQLLLDRGADINAQGGRYGNALQAACDRGHDKIAQLVLDQGADVNAQGGRYGNALQAACSRGHDKIAQLLLDRGVNVNAQGGRYGNALQAACDRGHDKIAQMLLDRGADVNAQGGRYGNALQAACDRGHDKIAQLLLDRGADVNAQGGRYGNALQAACGRGHDKIAQMLLDRGVNVNAQGGRYGNALQVACSRGYVKIAQMLLQHGADANLTAGSVSALSLATQSRNGDLLELLLVSGANVETALQPLDSTDDQAYLKQNALDYAAAAGNHNMVKILISAGADVNHASKSDLRVPLHLAAESGQIDVITALLDANADPTKEDSLSRNVLYYASLAGSTSVAQILESAIGHYNRGFKLGLCYRANTGGFSTSFTHTDKGDVKDCADIL